mmetsp:Transcript_42016/g.64356  ORF Transcript_42016/g.64356 Transcript_42016/m.64356 type:complete len:109 (-) Transcript_42016:163-489(-)
MQSDRSPLDREKPKKMLLGFDQNTFPMIRDEKEELFEKKPSQENMNFSHHDPTVKLLEIQKSKDGSSSHRVQPWTNPAHMQRLEEYLSNQRVHRTLLIDNLNKNMESI